MSTLFRSSFAAALFTAAGQAVAQAAPALLPLSKLIQASSPRLKIGTESEPGPTLLGPIVAVALDSSGNVYVLDTSVHKIKVFNPEGRYITSVGNLGRGPGDFAAVQGLVHDGKSSLYVVDRINGISVYSTENGRPTYKSRVATDWQPSSACILNGRLVVKAWHNDRILHVFNADGSSQSIGEPFAPDSIPMVRMFINRAGLIGCDSRRGIVYVLSSPAPATVRAYDLTGRVIWESRLPEYLGTRIFSDHGGVSMMLARFLENTVLTVGPNRLVIQARDVVRKAPRGRAGVFATKFELQGIATYVIDGETGRLLAREYGFPLIGAMFGDLAATIEEDPFPRVSLMTVTAK